MKSLPLALTLALAAPAALAAPSRSSVKEVADPLGTRGTLMINGRYDLWTSDVPLPGQPRLLEGSAPGVALSTDLYGKHLGFSLSFRALSTDALMADERELENSSFTLVEVQPDFNVVLVNANSLFLSAGATVSVRFNSLQMNEAFSRSVSAWYMAVAGANLRARYFITPHFYATATASVGFFGIAGQWVAAGVTTNPNGPPTIPPTSTPQAFFNEGSLESPFVVNGLAAVSFRPFEWFAATAGVAYRSASYTVAEETRERGDASESDLQPFVGVDFLY